MNVLQYEKAKLEVLQSKEIVLFNDSIEIQEVNEEKRRLNIKMNYAETDFGVTAYLTSPLDFIITTPEWILNPVTELFVPDPTVV